MPTVPLAENRVGIADVTGAKLQAADYSGTGLQAIGRGLQQVGGAVGEYAQAQDQIHEQLDNAGAKTLDLEYVTARREVRQRFLSTQGLNAGTERGAAEKDLRRLQGETIARASTPRMKLMLGQTLAGRVASDLEDFGNHATTQIGKAEDTSAEARITMSGEEAIAALTPQARDANLHTGLGEIDGIAARRGWDAPTTQLARLNFASGVHRSVISQMIDGDNVTGAESYLDANRGQITAKDEAWLVGALKEPLQTRESLRDVDGVMASPGASVANRDTAPVVASGQMFSTIKIIESGGRHFSKPGVPLTSPAGAIGVAQIMPATGPEAARDAGVAWDEQRFRSDPEYNARLGEGHFNKLLRLLGDPLKAAAAYNAGVGSEKTGRGVRGAVKRAREAGRPDNWRDYLPAETRSYVTKFVAGVGANIGPEQAPERHDLNELYGRVDTIADTNAWTPERRERAKREVDRRVTRDETLLHRREAEAERDALDRVDTLGPKFTSLGQLGSVVNDLSPSSRREIRGIADRNAAPKPIKPDGEVALWLNLMAVNSQTDFVGTDLRKYRDQVTTQEFTTLAILRERMKANPQGPEALNHEKIWSTIARYGADVGVDPTPPQSLGKAKIEENRRDAQRLFTMMQRDLNGVIAGKRQPTDDEVKSAWDRAIMTVKVPKSGFLYDSVEATPRFRAEGQIRVDVPVAVKERIASVMRRTGVKPSEQEIAQTYMRHKGKPGFWD